jgi:hypothetical protein
MYDTEHTELFKQLSEARDDGDESLYEELRLKALTGGIDWRRNDLVDRVNREFPPYGIEPVQPEPKPEFDPDFDREAALKKALDSGDMDEFVKISEQHPSDTIARWE